MNVTSSSPSVVEVTSWERGLNLVADGAEDNVVVVVVPPVAVVTEAVRPVPEEDVDCACFW